MEDASQYFESARRVSIAETDAFVLHSEIGNRSSESWLSNSEIVPSFSCANTSFERSDSGISLSRVKNLSLDDLPLVVIVQQTN